MTKRWNNPRDALRHHVSGAIERGEKAAISGIPEKVGPDFEVTDHGSIVLFKPLNANARDWLAENVESEGWQWFGGALAVEPRYAETLGNAIWDAGFLFPEA